jgi:hypothetical protein
MPPHADPALRQPHTAWYRQPVVWLGVLVFVASIAGCVWIITVGIRHADTPVATSRANVLGVPASPHRAPQPATSARPQ